MEPDAKIDEPIHVPVKPRGHWRKVVRRILKLSLIGVLLASIGFTTLAWNQSAQREYYCGLQLGSSDLVLHTRERQIYFGWFMGVADESDPTSKPESYRIQIGSYSPRNMVVAIKETFSPRPLKIGFGFINKIERSVQILNGAYSTPPPNQQATFKGFGLIMPYWFALLILGSILMFVLMGQRFSLRAFLIWVTVVCVILAIAVRTSGDSSQNQDRSVRSGT